MVERHALLSTLAVAALVAGAPLLAATAATTADAGPTYNREVAPILARSVSPAIARTRSGRCRC